MRKVAIIGVGHTSFRSISPDVSYKELMYEAAVKAYEEAGVCPRNDIDCFVDAQEDFEAGRAISHIQIPDQLGAVLKPSETVCGDSLLALIIGYMHILTGERHIVAVEAYSKTSNMLTPYWLAAFAMDPIYNRPLRQNPYFIAGMEMNRYMYESATTREQCAMVSVKNKANGLDNPIAVYGDRITVDDVLNSEMVFYPLNQLDISSPADGCIVMVLASEERAKALSKKPIWIKGVGWATDTHSLQTRDWGSAVSTQIAAKMAYKQANITCPRKQIDFAEIDDCFSYKELQHMEALNLCSPGEAGKLTVEGVTQRDGELPINVSGGSLGVGRLVEATGLQKALEVVIQLRGEAGKRQLAKANVGLAHAWRGIPHTSSAVVILSNED